MAIGSRAGSPQGTRRGVQRGARTDGDRPGKLTLAAELLWHESRFDCFQCPPEARPGKGCLAPPPTGDRLAYRDSLGTEYPRCPVWSLDATALRVVNLWGAIEGGAGGLDPTAASPTLLAGLQLVGNLVNRFRASEVERKTREARREASGSGPIARHALPPGMRVPLRSG